MAVTLPSPLRVTGSATGALAGKPAPVKPTAVNPLASVFAPVDYAGLAGQATSLANANTAPVIAGLQGEQAYDTHLAGQRAGLDTSASIAAAKFLQGLGLGPKLGAMYRQAGQDQAGLAAGFSGDLQRTVGDQAAHVNAGLAALGLTGAASNTSAQAGNTVYGVGGLIPANAMLASAPSAVAAANAQPAALLGVGQQAASSEIGAGAQAAAKIDPQIAAALAKEPALASTYLSQFTKAAETGRQNNISDTIRQEGVDKPKIIGSATAGYYSYDPTTGDRTTLVAPIPSASATRPIITGSDKEGRFAINPTTGKVTQIAPAINPPTAPKVIGSDKSGRYIVHPDGSTEQITKPVGAGTGGLSPASLSSLTKAASKLVTGLAAPPKQRYTPAGFVPVPGTGPATYPDTLRETIALGPNTPGWKAKATQIVRANPAYAPGNNGRPYETIKQALPNIASNVAASIANGHTAADVYQAFLATGVYPAALQKQLVYSINRLYTRDYFAKNPSATALPANVLAR